MTVKFMNKPGRSLTLVFLIIVVIAFFIITGDGKKTKPNLILITIDTLRADHLSAYGYKRNTSPFLSRLAREGVVFENAFTAATRTTQSLAAMITGRYPQTIGVRAIQEKLSSSEQTLAEVLKQHGYHTGSVQANPIVKDARLGQGFDFFAVLDKHNTGPFSNLALLDWLKRTSQRPIFAWIHYFDPHRPYQPPKIFRERFTDPDYRGLFEKQFLLYKESDEDREMAEKLFIPKIVFNKTNLSQEDLVQARNLYDGEIAFTDLVIAQLYHEMKKLGVLDNALIIICADHGESLGEHRYFFAHGAFVYEPTAKVPLIFHWPGRVPEGVRISRNVRTIDLLPTILSLLGIPDPFEGREGKDLTGAIVEKEVIDDLPVFIESGQSLFPGYNGRRYIETVKGKIRAHREGDWKIIISPTESDNLLELYNLKEDPGETRNLAEIEPERTSRMAETLTKWMKKGENHIIRSSDEKKISIMRSLGYVQ